MKFRTPVAMVVFVMSVLPLFLSSCGNETPTVCPLEGYGAIEGYVRASGHGVAVRVAAILEEGDHYGVRTFVTESDSTGWYHLDLPSGVYRVEVKPEGVSSISIRTTDTIRVNPRVIRFDLERCRAEISLDMPAGFDDQTFRMILEVEEGSVRMSSRQTEGKLRFDFPAIPPGFYAMKLDNLRLGRDFYLRRPTAPGDVSHIWVDEKETARFALDFRERYATLGGTVAGGCIDSGSRPYIVAFSPDSLEVGKNYCDSEGNFELIFLEPGPVRLMSRAGDIQTWLGGSSFDEATLFDLNPGDRLGGVEHMISGFRLLLEGPGELTSYNPVVLVLDGEGNAVVDRDYYGDPVTVCNLVAGRYFLKVDGYCNEQVWAPQWFAGAADQGGATPIDLDPGEFRQLQMQLVGGGRLSGVMQDAAGQPAPIDNLAVFDDQGAPLCEDWRNQRDFPDGQFGFPGLADGAYHLGLRIWAVEEQYWWYPGTYDFSEATAVVITDGAQVSGLDWPLPPVEEGP